MTHLLRFRKVLLIAIPSLLFLGQAKSQGSVSDETLGMSLLQFQGGLYQPHGDMAELYGGGAFIGFSYAYKTKNNWLWGADYTYMFGDNVKNKDAYMTEIRNNNDDIIGIDNEIVNYLILQRGFTAGVYTGKIFPIFGPNPNSGLVVKLGVDFMMHKTFIEARQDDIPPIEGEYQKGYDRKRGGFLAHEFIGYQHFSNSKYANFYVGFDFYQGVTVDYRSYNFDAMDYSDNEYFDMMLGFRVGWVIPIYRRVANKFYLE